MSKPIPSYLKLVTETPPPAPRVDEDAAGLLAVCEAFTETTGYTLDYRSADVPRSSAHLLWSAPVVPGVGVAPGLLRLWADTQEETAEPGPTRRLAATIADLWGELLRTRRALWLREAELAAGVPVIEHRDEAALLAPRLESILKAGAEGVDCSAAALYLLDDATSELKLRATWGLPQTRLLEEPRPLANQLADLEALLGHAVVLSDPNMFGLWRVPEPCAAAVCVPVSSPTIPLGTLWFFAEEPREFSDRQTNLIELTAGRLAGELEREAMLRGAAELRRGAALPSADGLA